MYLNATIPDVMYACCSIRESTRRLSVDPYTEKYTLHHHIEEHINIQIDIHKW